MSTELALLVLFSLADVSGYVQTPRGGLPGTTDVFRPTFEELAITQAPIIDRQFTLPLNKNSILYGGSQEIRLTGQTELSQTLKTYRIVIPEKTLMDSAIRFDWYHLGYAYAFNPFKSHWKISPEIELAVLNFSYRFLIPWVDTERAYRHLGVRLGISFEYQLSDQITLRFRRSMSLPWPKILQISHESLSMQIQEFIIGHQITQIHFKDSQQVPNHLHLRAGPAWFAGKFEENK